jgi:dolichol kinase
VSGAGGLAAAAAARAAGASARRRTVHVASGVLALLAARLRSPAASLGFALLVAAAAAAETIRLASPRAHAWLDRLAGGLFRPSETAGISGATTLALGYALAWWLFPVGAAERAILVTALADPMAAAVGTRFGGGARKSWWGSAACLMTAAVVLLVTRVPLPVAAAAAAGAAVAERAPWRGADNVTVPVAVAAVLRLLA